MTYENTVCGTFLSRPNRFIAHVDIDGRTEVCHVKNTGRCRELLIPGAHVILTAPGTPGRKTKYDLIAVYKGQRLINMDAQAPNRAAAELLPRLFPDLTLLRPETAWGRSRFDFYLERQQPGGLERPGERAFLEVKGVTLERGGAAYFPDAPTARGVKHIRELMAAKEAGYGAYLLFLVQMRDVLFFSPNDETHLAFGVAIREAAVRGVTIFAYDCDVTENSMTARAPVEVRL